jgi:hypothetical protein
MRESVEGRATGVEMELVICFSIEISKKVATPLPGRRAKPEGLSPPLNLF